MKDGTQRFCVNYRRLNEETVVETSQLPPIADTLMELDDAKVFSTLDLKSGYWQMPVAEESHRFQYTGWGSLRIQRDAWSERRALSKI